MISFLAMLAGSLWLDTTVRPRQRARWLWQGVAIHFLAMTTVFGFFLFGSGSFPVAAILALALMALLATTSNAKHAMLGEPLLFSDLALIAALFRHPRFYFTAISRQQRCMLAAVAPILLLVLAGLFVPRPLPHILGLGLLSLGIGALAVFLVSGPCESLAQIPDVDADMARYGMIATLLLYWIRWRHTPDPVACSGLSARPLVSAIPSDRPPELIVIVQCESFADPADLTGSSAEPLPGLTHARTVASQWGNLDVSWFGAYTMRTEYGVLFGRSERELGFRRYDPFLTALREASYALPFRLRDVGYKGVFAHPHEMRFYGRDRLMPAIGFDHIIGEEGFLPFSPERERYIDDQTLGERLGEVINAAIGPMLLYAVTMENHGPWMSDRSAGSPGGLDAYLRHLRSSDRMLSALISRLSAAGRSALLVFFGDHRPSIPGVTAPGGACHTPYVMLRFAEDGTIITDANRRVDLSPDELHHAILRSVEETSPPVPGTGFPQEAP